MRINRGAYMNISCSGIERNLFILMKVSTVSKISKILGKKYKYRVDYEEQ